MKNFIKIDKPTTLKLKSNRDSSRIYDEKGRKIFHRFFKGKADNFSVNLPRKGVYYFDENTTINDILPLEKNRITFELPPQERSRYKPFKIVHNKSLTSTPARIFTEAGVIEVSDRFYQFDPQIRLFILLHELGHYFYKTEWKTDLFALYYYLQLGYNKSQAFYALSRVLHPSPSNMVRIKSLFNAVK